MTAVIILIMVAVAVCIIAFGVIYYTASHDQKRWDEWQEWHDRYHQDLYQ